MRALVQRVSWAEVEVDGRAVSRIEKGLLVYLGIGISDSEAQIPWLAQKIAGLRIFTDAQGKMNLSVQDVGGGVLVISNFTLMGDARKGRRPEFTSAAPANAAQPLYEAFLNALAQTGCRCCGGVFQAHMAVRSEADGPVNIVVDSVIALDGNNAIS